MAALTTRARARLAPISRPPLQASSGAIRRINRFREADRMFSSSSVTSGPQSAFVAKAQSATASASLNAAGGASRGAKVNLHLNMPGPTDELRAPRSSRP